LFSLNSGSLSLFHARATFIALQFQSEKCVIVLDTSYTWCDIQTPR